MQLAAIIISSLSFIVSVIVACFSVQSHFDQKKRLVLSRAPNYIINSLVFSPQDYVFPSSYSKPDALHFLLAKCNFFLQQKNSEVKREYCLVLDLRPDSSYKEHPMICFDTMEIRNNGFEALYLEFLSIDIFVGGKKITIEPSNQKSINELIDKDHPLKLMLSMYIHSKSEVFDAKSLSDKDFLSKKMQETNGELLGSRWEEMADKWNRIVLHIYTKNTYNEIYTQDLILTIDNNTYRAENTEPVFINKKVNMSHH